jgi:hypothetical protein
VNNLELAEAFDDFSRAAAKIAKALRDETTRIVHEAAKQAKATPDATPRAPKQKPIRLLDHNDPEPKASNKLRRTILIALAQFGRPMSTAQVGLYSGKAHKGGAFAKALAELRRDECVSGPGSEMSITQAGFAELGDWARLPEGSALFEFWCSKLGPMEEDILRDLRPRSVGVSTATIGESIEKAHTGGAFAKAMARLRKMELVEGPGHDVVLSPILRRALEPTINVHNTSTGLSVKLDARKGHVK